MVTLNYSNKKSLESQKKIYKSLRKLLLNRPLSEITVTDLCTECGISRTTFYRNFNNITDVLDVIFDFYYARYYKNRNKEENKLLYFFNYWIMHRDLVHIITHQCPSILDKCFNLYTNKVKDSQTKKLKIELFTSIISKWSETKIETPMEKEKEIRLLLTQYSINLLLD